MAEQTLKEKTAKGLFWGGLSSIIQQLLVAAFGIVLLRELTPGDYGMIGMLAIFTGIASTIQESGFTAALINRSTFDPRDFNAVFWFNFFVSCIFYIILFFAAPYIADFYGYPELNLISRILFISLIINSMSLSHYALLLRELMLKEKAKIDVISSIISGTTGITFALLGYGYWALVFLTLMQSVVCTTLRWIYSPWNPSFSLYFRPVKEMFGFSFKLLLSSIITQVQNNIFSILLGRFYTVSDVGYYSQGNKWSVMGATLIHGTLIGVTQPLFAKVRQEKERIVIVFRKMFRLTAFITFPILLGIAFIAREFIFIINAEFAEAILILQIYCVSGVIGCFILLYSQMCVTLGRSDYYFRITVICAILQIFAAILSISKGMYMLAMASMLVTFFNMILWHYYTSKIIRIRWFDILRDVSFYLLITIFSFVIAYFVSSLFTNLYLILATKILVSVLLYVGISYFSGSAIFNEMIYFILKKKK